MASTSSNLLEFFEMSCQYHHLGFIKMAGTNVLHEYTDLGTGGVLFKGVYCGNLSSSPLQ